MNNVQELWEHCKFCPICQKSCRHVSISVGPDAAFELTTFSKEGGYLNLHCKYKYRKIYYDTYYIINCNNNTFEISVSEPKNSSPEIDVTKAAKASFYFYIQSNCPICDRSVSYSSDLELDILRKQISNIGLEREAMYLLQEKEGYHISKIYDRSIMLISRCTEDDDGIVNDSDKHMELPLVNLDFSNPTKVINKIKTLILFS